MCGIVGIIAEKRVSPLLLQGLKRIEYRGYDSAGIATQDGGRINIRKDVGKIAEIERKDGFSSLGGKVGIAHTRWATHGSVTPQNAHPHSSCLEKVAIVHNGIIRNHLQLKEELLKRGHVFKSETDSEAIAHLIEEGCLAGKDPARATSAAAKRLKGQYAFVVLFQDFPNVLTGARNDAPLLVGLSDRKKFFASDVLAFIEHTDRVVFLDNLEVAELSDKGLRVLDFRGHEVKKDVTQIAWELADISKLDYAHYTLKEIHEQPDTIQNATLQNEERLDAFVKSIGAANSVFLTAAGSSYHAALMMKYRLNREARVRCDAVLAGEFTHQSDFLDEKSVLVAISQSGETADVLEAVKFARKRGAKVLSIVNASGSSLARESDNILLLNCGPEVGVAATKSFTSQLIVSNLVVDRLIASNTLGRNQELRRLVELSLATDETVRGIARAFRGRHDFYFVARGVHYAIALEGALKLKELSYAHAEGMPASELKHGTLALIDKGTPVVVINPGDETYEDTIANAHELKARGAQLVGIVGEENSLYDHAIVVPKGNSSTQPILEVIPLQLLAYYMATERKKDPDYPRNLAKSVTVK